MRPDATRTVAVCERHELRRTLAPLRQGGTDPTGRHTADGSTWRATRTPAGPGPGVTGPAAGRRRSTWRRGARAPSGSSSTRRELLGVHDRVDGWPDLAAGHPVLRRLAHDHSGFRLGRSLAVYEALVPTILAQKVTGREAKRSWRAVVRRWGEPAPGPVPLVLPPPPDVLAGVGYQRAPPARRRAQAGRDDPCRGAVTPVASKRSSTLSRAEAARRLLAVPGIGVWTAAEVALIALGDSDAVSVGDFHIPTVVCFALAGERARDRRADARAAGAVRPAPGPGHPARRVGPPRPGAPRAAARADRQPPALGVVLRRPGAR